MSGLKAQARFQRKQMAHGEISAPVTWFWAEVLPMLVQFLLILMMADVQILAMTSQLPQQLVAARELGAEQELLLCTTYLFKIKGVLLLAILVPMFQIIPGHLRVV